MAMINVTIQVDEALKEQFEALLKELGLDMETAITMFMEAVVREGRMPFEITPDLLDDK